jgi:hypothetical protein
MIAMSGSGDPPVSRRTVAIGPLEAWCQVVGTADRHARKAQTQLPIASMVGVERLAVHDRHQIGQRPRHHRR